MKFLSLVCPTVVLTVRSGYNNRHRSVMCTAHALALCTYSYVLLALRTVDGQDGTDRQCHVQRVTAVHGRNRCSKTLSQLLNQQGCQHGSRFSRDFRTGFVGVIGTAYCHVFGAIQVVPLVLLERNGLASVGCGEGNTEEQAVCRELCGFYDYLPVLNMGFQQRPTDRFCTAWLLRSVPLRHPR